MPARRSAFLAGLFLATLATLLLELLNTRLLSVVTWYHLSFFAVSTAMFGMSAGAIRVYLGGSAYEGEAGRAALARWCGWLALAIPLSHIVVLCTPIRLGTSGVAIAGLVWTTIVVAIPFYLSGVVVAIALTRIPGPPGLVYAVDLLGAAAGAILILPLLENLDISSTAIICGAIAAAAAALFARFSGTPHTVGMALLAASLVAAALANSASPEGLRVVHSKGRYLPRERVVSEAWSIHGRVLTMKEKTGSPSYWGAGRGVEKYVVDFIPMDIDGVAATVMTRWNGIDLDELAWVSHDVSALPYHLRRGGDAAVIGVGGGRDILTALWARSRSVTGVEINGALLHNLQGPFRAYAGISDRPEVTLVHDEARSHFTRTDATFDVLQMSLIDTWAATGAGAFTLSENGLYTLEAWREFLRVLKPDGIFSVSRWYSPRRASETTRLLALATASLIDRGVPDPRLHLILVARNKTATLLTSPTPFSKDDVAGVERVSRRLGFEVLLAPGSRAADPFLETIAASGTAEALALAVHHERFDYTPPSDRRPYFFNVLKPRETFTSDLVDDRGALVDGNLLATRTLMVLWAVSVLLVAAVILLPLARSGRPGMDASSFAHSLAYFALIGAGFMLVQIPLIQRFSVYLGHPTHAVAVILFSMILATGAGSYLSDRVPIEAGERWTRAGPLGIALILLFAVAAIQPIIDSTIRFPLVGRCAVVIGIVGAAAFPLGFCFPLGLRLVRRISEDATPWLWGINGAFGVLSSVSAIWISMWVGIDTSLLLAAAIYLALLIPASALQRRGLRLPE
jgi:SAM-dependent methyltransferase